MGKDANGQDDRVDASGGALQIIGVRPSQVRSVDFGAPSPEEMVDALAKLEATDELGRPLNADDLKRKMRQAEKALEGWLT